MGLLLLPFMTIMNGYSPPKDKIPEGYSSHILAFEFASNTKELEEAITPLTDKEIGDLDKLNYVDFGFMLFYGLLLFLFITKLAQVTNTSWPLKARWIAPIVVIFDVLENIQLLRLSHFQSPGIDPVPHLSQLQLFTWSKWLLLALTFAIIGSLLAKMSNRMKWLGLMLGIPLVMGIGAFVSAQRWSEDAFASSIFGAFFVLFAFSILYKAKETAALK